MIADEGLPGELADKLRDVVLVDEGRPHEDDELEHEHEEDVIVPAPGAKKKKKKPKKRKPAGSKAGTSGSAIAPDMIVPEEPARPSETPDQTLFWEQEVKKGRLTHPLPGWGLLESRYRPNLDIFLTPSCRNVELITPRLRLRQVRIDDREAIRRIKMEPIVQKTQLYGSPSREDIKNVFLNRYIRSSMPRGSAQKMRNEFVFAITLKDPSTVKPSTGEALRIANRIEHAQGYLGNIALGLEPQYRSPALLPQKGVPYSHPSFAETTKAALKGTMFYELHPQLWGKGIMSEAFTEVLRFAMEEVGVDVMVTDPTEKNDASIRLCLKNGMKFISTETNNPYGKPQLFHEITREEWWARNRPGREIKSPWEGKEACRWCMDSRLSEPTVQCSRCDWARYCSRECQRADWVWSEGHQAECDMKEPKRGSANGGGSAI